MISHGWIWHGDFPWFLTFKSQLQIQKLQICEFRIIEVMVSPEGKVFYHRKAAEEFYGKAGPVMVSRRWDEWYDGMVDIYKFWKKENSKKLTHRNDLCIYIL